MNANNVPSGTWVQIRQQILAPDQRAPQVPADTANTPLVLVIKGFLQKDARIGDKVKVKTLCGRLLEGELIEALPRYTHDFGEAIPELLAIGPRVRAMLKGGQSVD